MKRNNITTYLMAAVLGSMLCTSCQDEESINGKEEAELSFTPDVQRVSNQENITRATPAAGGGFFDEKDVITIDITTNRAGATGKSYNYTLDSNGIFTGSFRFNLDNTYIAKLQARWPSDAVRADEGVKLDQRKQEDYQKADRLTTEEITNIMPTAEPVPLKFKHEQSRFTFRMAGQNANGLNIQSIILELQYDDPYDVPDAGNIPGAFWAYCNNTETASLVLLPGMEIKGTSKGGDYQTVNGRYMIGMAEIGTPTTKYTGGIWLSEDIAVTLKANTDYLVTLTPEGYDLMATIEIHGFDQEEGFIGNPEKP